MTLDEVKQQIHRWDSVARDITIVGTGANNVVGLAGPLVYRFPVTSNAVALQLYEVALYKRLNGKLDLPVPQLIRIYDDPKCIVITRLPGRHIGVDDLAKLAPQKLRLIIRQLLHFSIALNKALDPETTAQLERTYIPGQVQDRLWGDYFERHLKNAHFPRQPWLQDLAHQQYTEWLQTVTASRLPLITIHEDLNDQNILFTGDTISGILDFEECTTGTIAQELRPLFRIGEQAVDIAIEEYAAMTGTAIDPQEIAVWAITQELGAYCRWQAKGNFERPSYIRSRANLRRWLAGFQG